jgi:hypothetical protein
MRKRKKIALLTPTMEEYVGILQELFAVEKFRENMQRK